MNWIVGGLFVHDNILLNLPDNTINSVFGGLPTSIWHCGRVTPTTIKDEDLYKVESLFNVYNEQNISIRLVFSAPDLDKLSLDDKVGNTLLQYAYNSSKQYNIKNGVIVTNEILSNYIHSNYPNLTRTLSSIRPAKDYPNYDESYNWYNKMCEQYDYVVIRPSFDFDDSYLSNLIYKDKIEILVNNICRRFCTKDINHMRLFYDVENTRRIYGLDSTEYSKACNDLQIFEKICRDERQNLLKVTCLQKDIDRIKDLGFTLFKLGGREYSQEVFYNQIKRYILS